MTHSNANAAALVSDKLALLNELDMSHGILDLACGNGRNGLFLVEQQLPVIFADVDGDKLTALAAKAHGYPELVQLWHVDFEQPEQRPLRGKTFDAILVFNYLHRQLMADIRQAVRQGGLVFYETFTVGQREFGRPRNPDFLLAENELKEHFADWEILHYFEGERENPNRAIASLVARRPAEHG
jgi:SAM-dependent methyltransferase